MRLNRPPTDVHHLTPSTEAGPGEVPSVPARMPCRGPNALVFLDRPQISPVKVSTPRGKPCLSLVKGESHDRCARREMQ